MLPSVTGMRLFTMNCDQVILAPATKIVPPTMLPSVTGMRLFTMNCDQVILAPASMPCGIKNMLATECSKPSVMNALMGSQMASSLPPVLWLDMAPHTPRHTSQLQRMALEKATVQGSDTFIVAMPTAA